MLHEYSPIRRSRNWTIMNVQSVLQTQPHKKTEGCRANPATFSKILFINTINKKLQIKIITKPQSLKLHSNQFRQTRT